jgi:hypothetical protein
VLGALFVTPAATAITEALGALGAPAASGRPAGPIAVIGNARIAKVLAGSHDVIPVGLSVRAARKQPRAIADLTGVEPGSLAAVIGVDLALEDDWQTLLGGWARVVRDGGAIVVVDSGHPHEASRRALCGGLSEIVQRHAGRTIITSGLVTHLDR